MKSAEKNWLDEYAVTCRVFKGRWSIRHCVRMYNDIKDLRIHASSRARGKVVRHESRYNPCRHCAVLAQYIENDGDLSLCEARSDYRRAGGAASRVA